MITRHSGLGRAAQIGEASKHYREPSRASLGVSGALCAFATGAIVAGVATYFQAPPAVIAILGICAIAGVGLFLVRFNQT
jgi:hypothetical protein